MKEWLRRVFRPRTWGPSEAVTVSLNWCRWLVGVEFAHGMLQVFAGPLWLWVVWPGCDDPDF